MEFRVLGPLEVRENGSVLELGGAKQRAVLALLLLHANEVVSLDRLIAGVWGERPPDTAAAAVHGSISRLRKVLEPDGGPYQVIRTQAPGYVFAAGPEAVDRYRFERLATEGKHALDEGNDELGIAPGPGLRELERRILLQDPELAGPRVRPRIARELDRRRTLLASAAAAFVLLALVTVVALVSTRNNDVAPVERVVSNGVGAIDPATNTLVSSISVGSYPEHLAVGEGSIWVANAGDHTVSQVDTSSGQATTTKGLTGAPVTLNLSRDTVWIGMSHVDQPTSIVRLTGVPNESAAHVVELTKGPGLIYPVLADGPSGLWVSLRSEPDTFVLTPTGGVHRLDVLPRDCIPVGSGIAAATVWIGCQDGRLVQVDEATRRRLSTIAVGTVLTALAVGEGAVWASDLGEDVVWRIDATTGRPTRTIPVGKAPLGIAVGFGSVWVVNRDSGTVSRIDPRENRVVATVRVGRDAEAIAVGEGRVWLTVPGAIAEH